MIKKLVLSLILLIPFLTGHAQNGWRLNEMEALVPISGIEDIEKIHKTGISYDLAKGDGSMIRVYITPEEFNLLRSYGFQCTITIADLNQHYAGYWDNPQVPPGYYSYEEIIAIADSLALNFPSICKKVLWGTSYGGRQLAALKISDNVNVDENEAEIIFDGGIHGDEIGGSENVIRYARDLCLGYGTNPSYTSLINSREIWLYLMVNPDGRVNMSRYNMNMVDINRDFGYMWNGEGGSPDAFSQIESRTLRNCQLDNQFVVNTSYHSGTEIISYPWSYRPDPPLDVNHIDHLANVYSTSSGYPILQYGQGYIVMYAINGSTKDYAYGALGSVGWSIEISLSKQPPASQIPVYYNYNVPAMTEMINRSGYGVEGIVTDSLTGEPVRATIWVSNFYPVNTDPLVGDYHKYVLPGAYSIRASASGYISKTISGITVPSTGSVVKNFQLVPDTHWYAYRVMSCQIPNNNFGDEGYTPGCLGAPDNIAYSLGRNGWIVIDMGDTLFNGPGNDVKIYQAGSAAENFQLYTGTTPDGPWTFIGDGTGTCEFDLGTSLIPKVRYLRIKDQYTGPSTGPDVGYDLDAIEMLTPPILVDFTADTTKPCAGTTVDFTDESIGNGVSWSWLFQGGTPSTSSDQNPSDILYSQSGVYYVSLTVSNGFSSSSLLKEGYITVKSAPFVALGNDTAICAWDSITLDAGNPGSIYQWNTGATTQIITVDSTGIGFGSGTFWVSVEGMNFCVGYDTIVVTFDDCTGIGKAFDPASMKIYPNPTKGMFRIDPPVDHGYLEIINTLGISIYCTHFEQAQSIQTDLSFALSGIYFIRITSDDRTFSGRIILK